MTGSEAAGMGDGGEVDAVGFHPTGPMRTIGAGRAWFTLSLRR
jgi:hypothetical protein